MNYTELEELLKNIKYIVEKFEKNDSDKYRYKFYLANGEKIQYSIPINTLPHLLGIKIDYLAATGIFKTESAIELTKELYNNAFKINKLHNEGIIDYNQLFSKHVKNKVRSLLPNIAVNEYETEIVCLYDRTKSYNLTENNQKFDCIIIKKFLNGKIGLLCLVKNDNYYVPMSNRIYNDLEEANDFLTEILNNQTITILNGISASNFYTDFNRNTNLHLNAKAEKIELLKFYSEKFNAKPDILEDYVWAIESLKNRRINYHDDYELIKEISNSISNGEIIHLTNMENNNLIEIINAFNNLICNNQLSNNESNSKKYSELIEELKELRNELYSLKIENNDLKKANYNLTIQNQNLDEENKEINEKHNQIIKILKPEN